jgi:uncharacterized protein
MNTAATPFPPHCRYLATLLITLNLLTACDMDKTKLPPHMQELPPFDPHIASFECQTEASKVPPIDAQANDWFLEARAMEDGFVYVDDVDYKKVVQLTRQAADRHHWKAMLNLASLYVERHDPPNGEDEAMALVSQALELGFQQPMTGWVLITSTARGSTEIATARTPSFRRQPQWATRIRCTSWAKRWTPGEII